MVRDITSQSSAGFRVVDVFTFCVMWFCFAVLQLLLAGAAWVMAGALS